MSSKGTDETLHLHSLVKGYAGRLHKVWELMKAPMKILDFLSQLISVNMLLKRVFTHNRLEIKPHELTQMLQ